MTRSVKRTRRRSRQRARPKTRRKTRQRVKHNRTKNYSKKRKNTRKKNYSKKVAQEGGVLGCFGKEKLVEDDEDANDVFRRLITEGEELPQDTMLYAFGHEWLQQGSRSLQYELWQLEYSGYDVIGSEWIFQGIKPDDRSQNTFYFDASHLKIFLEDDIEHMTAPIQAVRHGSGGKRGVYFEFVNSVWEVNAGGSVPSVYGLNSDKINEEVDKNTMKETNKAKKEEKAVAKAAAKAAAKEAKVAANETKAAAKAAKMLGVTQRAYQSGTEYFTGKSDNLITTGFTVPIGKKSLPSGSAHLPDESVEVNATEPELQPAPPHDESFEVPPVPNVTPRKTNVTPRKTTIMARGSEGGDFIRTRSKSQTSDPGFRVPTSPKSHAEDLLKRQLHAGLERWTQAQMLEGDGNAVTEHAKAHYLGLIVQAQQKHAAARADRPSMRHLPGAV